MERTPRVEKQERTDYNGGMNRFPHPERIPLLDHALEEPSEFRPEDLVASVREQRGVDDLELPEVCVLDFDGDLTDALVESGEAALCPG